MIAFVERKAMVLGAYQTMKEPLTDKEVMTLLDFNDMNSVRPRITELVAEGKLAEVGSTRCKITNRNVRLCEVSK